MKRSKGFTLIELLAVIVILAIIALIVVPKVFNILDSAKKETFARSAEGVLKTGETYYASNLLETSTSSEITFNCDGTECIGYKNGEQIKLNISGKPGNGYITITEKGKIELLLTNGEYCAVKNKEEENIKVENNDCKEVDLRLEGKVQLKETSGYYVYPNSKEIEVIENVSGGNLTCTSDDEEVATCSIKDATVIVVPGTKQGVATLTIKSEGNSKYKEASVAYVATTEKGLLTVNASDKTVVYDENPHGIEVTSENALIKYGTEEGTYDLDISPQYTEVGTYPIYYEVTKAGYNTVKGYKTLTITKAEGLVALEENSGVVEYNETKKIEITENKSKGQINIEVTNPEIVEVTVLDGQLNIKGKQIGSTTIKVISENTANYNETSTEYEIEVTKANNTLKLSSSVGQYTYPTGGTFEVIENTSGGKITCIPSDTSIADCEVNGTTITVILGTTKGDTTLTIKAAETENYNEGIAAYYVTTEEGLLSVTASDNTVVYDGNAYGITVQSSGATIKYGVVEGTYNLTESPTYTEAGIYPIYYEVTKAGYKTVTGYKTLTITKAEGSVTAPTAKVLTYTGTAQELITAGNSDAGTIQYKLGTGSYSTNIPTATEAGSYTVYYKVVGDTNHNDVSESSITVTINRATLSYTSSGYNEIYDGKAHGITVISDNALIKYGVKEGTYDLDINPTYINVGEYTVYYKITKEGYIDVTGSEKVIITKADNTLKLSSSVGQYTYPTGGTFEVTENTSGGKITCIPSDTSIADCKVNGTTITVILGTKEGDTTLTIKAVETANYNEGQAAYYVTTEAGLLSVTASDKTVVYDGNAYGITVESSGATIKYGVEEGTYNLTESPTYTEVGTYPIYYEVTKAGYNTIKGSKTLTITKAEGSVTAPTAKTLTYTGTAQELITAGNSDTGTIQYKLGTGSYSTNIPTATEAGSYTVYYKVVGDANHNDVAEKSITVTINKAEGSITAPTAKTLTYTGSSQTLINAGKTTTGTIQYKLGSSGTYSTNIPTATEAGSYIVYYKVVGDANHNDVAEGNITVTIEKNESTLKLSSNVGQYTYPTGGTFEVTENTSGGKITCTSSDTSIADCEVNGTTITVILGTKEGDTTLTIKAAETENYNEGQAAYYVTTEAGLLSVTASDNTVVYDGTAYGITVESSGSTIKYGTEDGTYNLTESPTYTDAGTYTIYYEVTKAGYKTVTGFKTLTIEKALGSLTAPTAKTLTYTGSEQELINAGSSSTGEIQYKLGETGSYSTNIPTAIEAGTYTVYYKVVGDSNHNDVAEKSITVTIKEITTADISYTNSNVSSITNVEEALDYLNEKLG